MNRPTVVAALVAGLCLTLAGCGGDTDTPTASTDAPAPRAAGLTFQTVEGVTAERFTADPNCPVGRWDSNSTGVDEEYLSEVAEFKQFDCYRGEGDLLPLRGQQSKYVRFDSEATARAYAKDESTLYPVLIAGTSVVVAGTGLDTVDMTGYLTALKDKAGAGELLT